MASFSDRPSGMAEMVLTKLNNAIKTYTISPTPQGIDTIILILELHIASTHSSHRDGPDTLYNFGVWLLRRHMAGNQADLNRAIDVILAAADAYSDRSKKIRAYVKVANLCWSRFNQNRAQNHEDRDRAICAADSAVALMGMPYSREHAGILVALGGWLGGRFGDVGNVDDLKRAAAVNSSTVRIIPGNHPKYATALHNFVMCSWMLFEKTGCLPDNQESLELVERSMHLIPSDPDDLESRLRVLVLCFERQHILEKLDEEVASAERILHNTPKEHPDRAERLTNFANCLGSRFAESENILDAERATSSMKAAVLLTPQDHPERAARLISLGKRLGQQFERTKASDLIDYAVSVTTEAIQGISEDHNQWVDGHMILQLNLGLRYQQNGQQEDIQRAINVGWKTLRLRSITASDQAIVLTNLGNHIGYHAIHTSSSDGLSRAVVVCQQALDMTLEGDHLRTKRLANTARWLSERYERTGDLDDLNSAITRTEEAIESIPEQHPDRPRLVIYLSRRLCLRSMRIRSLDDLDRAIRILREVADVMMPDHPERALCLNCLVYCYAWRYEQSQDVNDNEHAIETSRKAVQAAAPDDLNRRAMNLMNLGSALGRRFERTPEIEHIDQAIKFTTEAMQLTTPESADRATISINLGNLWASRYKKTNLMDDIDHSIDATNAGLQESPDDHLDRASMLTNLAEFLVLRFAQNEDPNDRSRAIQAYRTAVQHRQSPPLPRIRAGRLGALFLAEQSFWSDASLLAQSAVELLPQVTLRVLSNTDRYRLIQQFEGLASLTAACMVNAGKISGYSAEHTASEALQWLDQGRGIISNLALGARTDVSRVRLLDPELAVRFAELRDEINKPEFQYARFSHSAERQTDIIARRRRHEISSEYDKLIDRIRRLSGMEDFLRPKVSPQTAKLSASVEATVVINVSHHRCDAFLVRHDGTSQLELPGLTIGDVEWRVKLLQGGGVHQYQSILDMLAWLWDAVADPILSALGYTTAIVDDNWPHVRWIPTGFLSNLPLHAAGRHAAGSNTSVLDRVMSSYSSSIRTMSADNGGLSPIFDTWSTQQVVLAEAVSDLTHVKTEARKLKELWQSYKLRVATPGQKGDVLQSLGKCAIFHFAGHGRVDDIDPSQSYLQLGGPLQGRVTVADLQSTISTEHVPFLAYLSACSTGANYTRHLADESIHLISACELAGFRHVVGTLWEVADQYCPDVAQHFYETLLASPISHKTVCRSLHDAVRRLRSGLLGWQSLDDQSTITRDSRTSITLVSGKKRTDKHDDPKVFSWAPYVHYGI